MDRVVNVLLTVWDDLREDGLRYIRNGILMFLLVQVIHACVNAIG
jgi:hypothetical protein